MKLSPGKLRQWAESPGWPRHIVALSALWAAIIVIFFPDVSGLVRIWWTSSTYGHCLLIPFLIGWLVWQRRDGLKAIDPAAWWPGLLWLAGGALFWLLGDAAGLAVVRHGALILMMQGAVPAVLGPAVSRALLFPLFYAFFLIPAGSELEPALQLITAKMAVNLLHLFGVPAHIDGIFITTPNGYFKVAEACSGAKFLVAMTAYGVLVCHVCFRSWIRRGLFLAAALATCLLANGVRAFGTIYAAYLTTIEAAVGLDHIVYGWLFFAFVMLVIMLAAWPFFDRKPGDRGFDADAPARMRPRGGTLTSVLAAALLAMVLPPAWSRVSAEWGAAELVPPVLPDVPGWSRVATPMLHPWEARYDGAEYRMQARYGDKQGRIVDVAIASYSRQREGHELIGFGQGAADPDGEWRWAWTSPAWAPDGAKGEKITAPGPVVRHVVTFYRVGNGALTGSEAAVKFDTMKARLLGRDQQAGVVVLSAEERDGLPAEAALRAFLSSPGLSSPGPSSPGPSSPGIVEKLADMVVAER